jgi:plastocyanin domain-containing protein
MSKLVFSIACWSALVVCGACSAGASDKQPAPVFDGPLQNRVEMSVTERGFEPANIRVKQGEPVTLVITRKVDSTCATEIVLDEYGIHAKLPLHQPVTVSFTPKKSGLLKYGCAMQKMIGGVIRVE